MVQTIRRKGQVGEMCQTLCRPCRRDWLVQTIEMCQILCRPFAEKHK